MDIWRRIRKQASDTELLIVGRVFVVVLLAVSIVWLPIVQAAQNSQLFHYIQSVTSFLSPPVCAVYILAIVCKRVNEQGAFWGLMVGLVVGMIRFIWEFAYTVPSCASGLPDPRPDIIAKVHYLHFGILLFLISCIVTVAVSYATQPIAKVHLHRLLFWNRHSETVRVDITKKKVLPTDKAEMGEVNNGFQEGDVRTDGSVLEVKVGYPVIVEEPSKKFVETPPEYSKTDIHIDTSEKPTWQKILFFICGVSSKVTNPEEEVIVSAEDEAKFAVEAIIEKPLWRRVCNANAILLLVIGSFLWGFYA